MTSSRSQPSGTVEPPPFLRLTSHPLRWRLLQELVRSDRAVKELVVLVGEPQNLVSYHLRLLRDGGLVRVRRSSADGRDSYYSIDLVACRDGLQATGAALHPGLGLGPVPPPLPHIARSARRPRVLFLCTGNSARSQMAEGLLERMSQGTVDAASAGSHPKPLHRHAIRAMRARDIDISTNRSKHVDEFVAQRFDTVITLCDRVREVCPEFRSAPERVHWSMPDPSIDGPGERATYAAFERTAAELETRIGFRLRAMLNASTNRRTS